MADSNESPPPYSLTSEAVKFGKNPDGTPIILETPTERMATGIEASSGARQKITRVFDRFGAPLADSLGGKGKFPITVEGGGSSSNYRPQGSIANTGGMRMDYHTGDKDLGKANMAFHTTQEGYRAEVTTFSDIQTGYARWKTEAENRSNAANDYFIANQASLTQGWDLVQSGQAYWSQDQNGKYIMVPNDRTGMEQTKIIDTFNQVNIPYMNLSNLAGRAWDTTQQWADSRDRQFRYVDSARSSMTTAQRSLYNAEKMRYRYVFSGIDVDSKITASAALFTTLYKKEYSVADVRSQYLNSMDTLGMFMTKIQTGGVITEADYKKEILTIGKSLSAEEKIIFLGMVGANLNGLTYNWDKANSGKFSPVKPFESMQALAKAFQTGEQVPAGVCSSIHVAVASMAEAWGTPAGTMTVSSGGVGHVVAVMDIGGKKVISDYGKLYTSSTMEELIDTYSIANRGIAIRNYITDSTGKIVGHVETPLTNVFRREVLSELDVAKYLESGRQPEDGVNIALYNDRKGFRGQYTFENGIYIRGKYSESTLIPTVQSQTISVALGKQWSDIDLSGGWKGSAVLEGSLSKNSMRFAGAKSGQKGNIFQLQGGVRGEKDLGNGSNIYLGAGARIIGQGSTPTNTDYATLGPLGTGVSAESGMNITGGYNLMFTPDTKVSGAVSVDTSRGVNVQSISARDLNPIGQSYTTINSSMGIETKVGSGGTLFAKAEATRGPIANESTIGIGYGNASLKTTFEKSTVRATDIFGPTNQDIIRASIEGRISANGKWFAGVETGGISGKKAQVGAKWTF